MWSSHTVEYYSVLKKECYNVMKHLGNTELSEGAQKER